jgi:hypothetical protein
MRRFALAALSLALLLTITACASTEAKTPDGATSPTSSGAGTDMETFTFSGKIVEVRDGALLLTGDGAGDLYELSLEGLPVEDMTLRPGMLVDVAFDGTILETYPARFSAPVSLQVTDKDAPDNVGLYFQVISDLYAVDTGLNDGIRMVAVDLSPLTNLSGGEKGALLYRVWNAFGVEAVDATYAELVEQGLIDDEDLYFETGLLFTFNDMEIGDRKLTFSAEKWRGGLGAYFFMDCTAKLTNGVWSYTVGAEAIS